MRELKKLHSVDLNGSSVPVVLRRNPNARRMILRVEGGRNGDDPDKIAVTLPQRANVGEALQFVASKADWIEQRLSNLPQRIPIQEGTVVPFLGSELRICHVPEARRGVWRDEVEIFVSGNPEFLSRRVTDWIKREARREITDRVADKTALLGTKAGRISVRDTRSRWGSCASNGNLSFSWRLIMAPEFVFDYVIAHEVAHIEEHNHSEAFWRLVEGLTANMKEAKRWLRENGERLHRYG
jgi:predicted metal-dependent hydrolase